jgi:proton glutamate symport protein
MSLTLRILLALVLGLAIGAGLAAFKPQWLGPTTEVAKVVGGLWLDALRMTIVPLIFSLLVTGVASAAGTLAAGGVAARTLGLFAVLLLAAALLSALAVPAILRVFPIPIEAATALRAGLGEHPAVPGLPPIGDWLRGFVPVNPVGAAANGAIVPLVVFALVFGLAVTRIEAKSRASLLALLDAVVAAMLVIVRWVLWAAPAGVLALSLQVGATAGVGAAGALAHYVLVISAVCVMVTVAVYPLVTLTTRIPLVHFARAVAPAQLVAFSTQSSIASLPAMVDATQKALRVPEHISNLVLPLAVSLFRITSATANMAVAVYVAALFGVPLTPLTLGTGVIVAAIVSLAAVGLPSQVSFFTAIGPVCLAMGAPIAVLPLLLAIESIPDIFRTVGNVTADVAVTAMIDRNSPRQDQGSEAGEPREPDL